MNRSHYQVIYGRTPVKEGYAMTKEFILGLIHQGRLADARTWITQINVVDIASWLEELDGTICWWYF